MEAERELNCRDTGRGRDKGAENKRMRGRVVVELKGGTRMCGWNRAGREGPRVEAWGKAVYL